MFQQSEEENADEEFDFRPAGGAEEDQSEQFMSRCSHAKRQEDKILKKGGGRTWSRINSLNIKDILICTICSLHLCVQHELDQSHIFGCPISCVECNLLNNNARPLYWQLFSDTTVAK